MQSRINCNGTSPEKLLHEKSKASMLLLLPIEDGIGPSKAFPDKFMHNVNGKISQKFPYRGPPNSLYETSSQPLYLLG